MDIFLDSISSLQAVHGLGFQGNRGELYVAEI